MTWMAGCCFTGRPADRRSYVDKEGHQYSLGKVGVTVISDGARMADVAGFVTNAAIEDVQKALAGAGQSTEKIRNGYAPVVLDSGGKRVLIDTGNGEGA